MMLKTVDNLFSVFGEDFGYFLWYLQNHFDPVGIKGKFKEVDT